MGTSERLVGLSPAKGWRKWGIFTTLIYKSLRAALGYVRSPMFLAYPAGEQSILLQPEKSLRQRGAGMGSIEAKCWT